jgi:hypothetical protein
MAFSLPKMPFDFYPGLGVMVLALIVFLYARRVDARPTDPLNPRMIPWRTVQVASGVTAFLALIFVINLFRVNAPVQRW